MFYVLALIGGLMVAAVFSYGLLCLIEDKTDWLDTDIGDDDDINNSGA